MIRSWGEACALYLRPRLLVVLAMGFASGLPLLLTLSTLAYWLAKLGVDKTTIGLFALVGVPYALKFLWAPLLDRTTPPLVGRLGRRRGWLLTIQALLIGAIAWLGSTDPAQAAWQTALAALAVAFLSASQDVVIDAYRIEILAEDEQAAGAGATQVGYRIGLLAAGAGAVALSDVLPWSAVFAGLATLMVAAMAVTLLAPEPRIPRRTQPASNAPWRARLRAAVIEPFADFARRPGWIAILAFVLLYKFGDAIGGVMANPFYVELGFSGTEIATISKVFGVIATLVGGIAGGVLVARFGLFPMLWFGGIFQALANLAFAWLATVGHSVAGLTLAIAVDNFAGGLASAAFVAYLSGLCNADFTATQYALLSSLMAQGRTVLAASGGWLADRTDWVTFFSLTALLAIPGLVLLAHLALPRSMATPE